MKFNKRFIVLSLIFILSLSCFSTIRLRSESYKTYPDLGSNQDLAKVSATHEVLDNKSSINLVSDSASVPDSIVMTLESDGENNIKLSIPKEIKKDQNIPGDNKNANNKAKIESVNGNADESK